MPRLFIAIDFPNQIKNEISNIFFGVKGAKWVKWEQIHLTLRFIGDVDESTYRDIDAALEDIDIPTFSLKLKGTGVFPPRRQPKILWVGIEENKELIELHDQIEENLISIGLDPEDKKFYPHVTAARIKQRISFDEVTPFLSANGLFSTAPVQVSEFHLYSSILSSHGAEHRREVSYPLSY